MNIVVCLKQVPRDNTVAITSQNTIDASGIEMITNLFDEYALEAALHINDTVGGAVTHFSSTQTPNMTCMPQPPFWLLQPSRPSHRSW
jgi:electron transfer flavoprotein alpha/beta subunit